MSEISGAATLRAAFFTDAVPNRNGVGTYYQDLCDHLTSRIGGVVLFCPEVTENGWRDRIRLPLPGDATQKICVPNPRDIHRRFVELDPQVVVLSTPAPYGLVGLRLARKYRLPIVFGFHTHFEKLTDLYWKDAYYTGRLFRRYLEGAHRLMFRYSSKVLANSEDMLEIARRIGAPNPELMGTTIAHPFVERPVTPLHDRLEVVTFAGRLAAEKNIEKVIAAAEALPAIRFKIVGDGPQRDLVAAAAARIENLEYIGWVARQDMPAMIDVTDMLILPSQVESFGTIALEAMTRNRTVLVSQDCGINQWEQLSPGLFRIGADESVTDAIARVASLDPSLRQRKAGLGRAAAIALNEWTVNHWIETLMPSAAQTAHHG